MENKTFYGDGLSQRGFVQSSLHQHLWNIRPNFDRPEFMWLANTVSGLASHADVHWSVHYDSLHNRIYSGDIDSGR